MQLKNVKIINYETEIENADITIEDGIITSIINKPGIGTSIVIPGFIDTHVHGFAGHDAMDGIEAIETISKELKKHGTTSYLSTAMTQSIKKMNDALKAASKSKSTGATIIGVHMEGPFISIPKKGAHNEKFIIKPTAKLIKELQSSANGMIKKMTIAPEVFNAKLISLLIAQGIIPTIGHSNATALQAHKAIDAGATACTHLWNAMTGVANRKPGMVEAILQREEVYAELICDMIHVDAEAIKLTIISKGVKKVVAITDAIRPAGLPDGDSTSGGMTVTKKGNLITLKGTDTIAGSGATMYDNFINLIKLGYDIKDVVSMTSTNAAKNLGIKNIGQIEVGYQGDLVVMDKKLKIKQVLVKGI